MNEVPDWKKLRRQYLKQRNRALSTYADLAMLCALGSLTLYFNVVAKHRRHVWPLDIIAISLLVLLGINAGWRAARTAREDAINAYVPPVTPADNLPADEILVRSSEEPPVARSEVLLRAAHKTEETPQEELLRVNQE
jgi:hypothetical protein